MDCYQGGLGRLSGVHVLQRHGFALCVHGTRTCNVDGRWPKAYSALSAEVLHSSGMHALLSQLLWKALPQA